MLSIIILAGIALLIFESQPRLDWMEDLLCAADRQCSVGENIIGDPLMLPVHL